MSIENSKGAVDKTHAEMEKFATETVNTWHGQLAKLKELASAIERIEQYFSEHQSMAPHGITATATLE